MAGHAAGVARPCHYGKTRLSAATTAAVKAHVAEHGFAPTVRAWRTSAATLDKALHGLAMLARTAGRFEARFAPGSP